MSALLCNEFLRMAAVHAEPLNRVASRQRGELERMACLHPRMLRGVAAAERRLAPEAGVSRLLVLGNVPVGQKGVVVALPAVKILVCRQVIPRHLGMVGDVSTFDLCVFGCVPVAKCFAVRLVLLHHDGLLARLDDVGAELIPLPQAAFGFTVGHLVLEHNRDTVETAQLLGGSLVKHCTTPVELAWPGESAYTLSGEGRRLPARGDDEAISEPGHRSVGTHRPDIGDGDGDLNTTERAYLLVGHLGAWTQAGIWQNSLADGLSGQFPDLLSEHDDLLCRVLTRVHRPDGWSDTTTLRGESIVRLGADAANRTKVQRQRDNLGLIRKSQSYNTINFR
ncbi:hypothetical protein [Rhodococcus daqingensis]|uniref:Uncharacterized protein n=1 Tax=Rhodococcus daqingensis TaxID=2479363 RepID=A0ABW2S0I8_9NOCA